MAKAQPLKKVLTQEEIDAAFWADLETLAEAIQAKHKNSLKVLPFVVLEDADSERLVGFMYELDPMTDAKLYAAQLTGPEAAVLKALEASESIVLWAESDKRLNSKKFRKGVALNILSQVERSVPLLKKK